MQEIERRFWIQKLPTIQKKRIQQEIVQGYYKDSKTDKKIRIRKTTQI